MTSDTAIHESPVLREQANFLIFADLAHAGMQGRWEQLWAQQVAENEFRLCCIPYFTYGMALGDTVRTESSAGRKYVIADVLTRSGRRVLRLWLKNAKQGGRERVHQYLKAHSVLHEWSSENLLAIDAPAGEPAEELSAFLADIQSFGVDTEWGA